MTPHLSFQRFFDVLKASPNLFRPRKADVFRQSHPDWLSRPYRFTGVGSVFGGARWSVKGLMPTLYASLDPVTLSAEAYYKTLEYGWTAEEFRGPQLTIRMRWELQRVLDLTAADVRKALGITKKEMVECDWWTEQNEDREAVTQALGRAAFENLAEGLIVPSARRASGINIVYYPSHRQPGTTISTSDEAAIPFRHGLGR
jgi:RES domain-containing protein